MILEYKGEQFILTKKHEKDIHVQVIGTTQGGHKESVSCRQRAAGKPYTPGSSGYLVCRNVNCSMLLE